MRERRKVQPELVARLSADLDALASALQRAGAAPEAAARLLELTAAAIVDAVALASLRHAPYGLGEAGRVHALERKIESKPPPPARVVLTQQAHRPPTCLAL
jgi:hypothetical protein